MIKKQINNILIIYIVLFISCFMISYFTFSLKVHAKEKSELKIEMTGYGSQTNPYLISESKDIDNLREVINSGDPLVGKWFALTNDIDLNGERIEPISDIKAGMYFQGGFNGRGYKIHNFNMDTGDEAASFFGRMDGIVENLNLDGTISGRICASYANYGYGIILNCQSNCNLYAGEMAAGITNNWNGLIQNAIYCGNSDAKIISGIVNSGNGEADHVYSKNIEIGNISSLNHNGLIDELGVDTVINRLNESAWQCYLTLESGKWLNKWTVCKGGIIFSGDMAAFKGLGTEQDPFIIDSIEKLKIVAKYINAGFSFDGLYLCQTKDIDLTGHTWTDITDEAVFFSGVYNGNGHAIRGLNTEGTASGLFKNFNGKILNLFLEDCNTPQGYGFFGYAGESSLILNSYCSGRIKEFSILSNLEKIGQLVNCFIKDYKEPSYKELNAGLDNLVVNYGIHCGELYSWKGLDDELTYRENYKERYLIKERKFWKGNGVEKNPYQIGSLEDLIYLRESVYYNESFWRYWFVQTNDIDFSGVRNWRAIAGEGAIAGFYGIYDGNGKKIVNFLSSNTAALDGALFGNLRGTILNVHLKDCQVENDGNGILAYNVLDTAKVLNNVIEIKELSSVYSASMIQNNYGQVLNNIIIRPSTIFSVVTVRTSTNKLEDSIIPEQSKNQIVTSMTDDCVRQFNTNTLDVAIHIKQRITNFNLLNHEKENVSLKKDITIKSKTGLLFIKKTIANNWMLLLVVVWLAGCMIFYFLQFVTRLNKKKLYIKDKEIVQLFIILGLYFMFLFAIYTQKPEAIWNKTIIIVTSILAFVFIISSFNIIKIIKKYVSSYDRRKNYQYILIIMVLLFTAIIAVFHYNTPIAYDSDLYYGSFIQSIQNFQFSILDFIESFNIASKPMHGIAMLMAIGEAIQPGTGVGVYLINTFLLLLAQIAMYNILRKLFPKMHLVIVSLLVLCFAFSPYVIAGVTYINPDFYAAVTFVIFVYCMLYEYKMMSLYFGFLVMCSKPNMIISYFAFIVVIFFYKKRSNKTELKEWISYTIPAAVYLILYFGVNSLNRAGIPAESGYDFIQTISSRMLQYFAFGFIWIQEFFIIITIIYLLKTKKLKDIGNWKIYFLFAIWIACFLQLAITIVGGNILQLCPRYLTVCAVKNIILFALAIETLPCFVYRGKFIIVSLLSVLLVVQLFVTIDPFILLITEQKKDKLHYLVFPDVKSDGNDLSFYNYEYVKDAKYASKILTDLKTSEFANLYSDARLGYKMAIGSSTVYAAYWDTERNCRTYLPNENCVRLRIQPIIDGVKMKAEDLDDNCTIILRNEDNPYLHKLFSSERNKMLYDEFTIYKMK